MDNTNPTKEFVDEQLASDLNELLETVEATIDPFTKHTNDNNNPHRVTRLQLGLDRVDNTGDYEKPISFQTQAAIDDIKGKVGEYSSSSSPSGNYEVIRTVFFNNIKIEIFGTCSESSFSLILACNLDVDRTKIIADCGDVTISPGAPETIITSSNGEAIGNFYLVGMGRAYEES